MRHNNIAEREREKFMKQITNILLASDSLAGMDVALEKAAMVEHYSGADVCVTEVIYDTIAEEPPKVVTPEQQSRLIEALKAAERNGLRSLTEPYAERIASIQTRVLWSKHAADGVLQAQAESGAELIIKPVSQHGGLTDYIHTPLDWSIMRAAPCAVLVSKKPDWAEPEQVLAAIDVADARHEYGEGDAAILSTHSMMSRSMLSLRSSYGRERITAAYP